MSSATAPAPIPSSETGAAPARLLDDTLVARARAGDRAAFSELANRHETQLRRVVSRITHDCDTAYDVVQDALMLAWTNIGRFEGRSRFSTWLIRIGINEAYRSLKRRRFELPTAPDDLVGETAAAASSGPAELAESHDFLAAVERELAQLPLDYRTAVVLRDVEGLTTEEAAEILGIGQRALKSRLHRGRIALRRNLDAYLASDGA